MSVNIVNKTTGELTTVAGISTDKVGNLSAATTTNKSSVVAMVNEINSALAGKVSTSSVGSANGVAELDANGRVPSSQLPSYVDDTVEGYLNSVDGKFYVDSSYTTEITGETGKIYVTLDTNKTYRWSGSGFVEISESLALGETSSTAYAGNKGKANADAITAIKDGTNLDSFADVEDAFNYLTFEGTQADWNLLSTAEKKKYKQAIFTDDYDDNPVGNLNALITTDKSSCVGAINEVKSGLTKVATLSDNIHVATQTGALYRTSPIPIICDSEPTNVVVSVTRASGAIIGAMVHSISGTTVNVIIWATEETQETMKVVLFYR